MELQRVLLTSAGLLVVLSIATRGISQEPEPWLVSHLKNGQRIYMSGVTAQGRVLQNSHGMEGVVARCVTVRMDVAARCMVFRSRTLPFRF